MKLVDTSGWVEYLSGGPRAAEFAPTIESSRPMVASVIQVYELYKVVRLSYPEQNATEAIARLKRAALVPIGETLALEAADVALAQGLGMADALIYATAQRYRAPILTMDADFEGLTGVEFVPR